MSIQGCTDLISIVCHTLKDSSLQGLDTGQIFELTTNSPPMTLLNLLDGNQKFEQTKVWWERKHQISCQQSIK